MSWATAAGRPAGAPMAAAVTASTTVKIIEDLHYTGVPRPRQSAPAAHGHDSVWLGFADRLGRAGSAGRRPIWWRQRCITSVESRPPRPTLPACGEMAMAMAPALQAWPLKRAGSVCVGTVRIQGMLVYELLAREVAMKQIRSGCVWTQGPRAQNKPHPIELQPIRGKR